jgi:hypothetical protein
MSEPTDPFRAVRDAARIALLPSAESVRRRGRRRQLRARAAGVAFVAVVIGAGGTVAAASSHGSLGRGTNPATGVSTTSSAPSTAATSDPAPTRSGVPTLGLPTPDSGASTAQATSPAGMSSSDPLPSTSLGATPSAVAHLTATVHVVSAAGVSPVRLTFDVSGLVGQLYNRGPAATGDRWIPGTEQVQSTRVAVDGSQVGGSDGGDMGCHSGATLVRTTIHFADGSLVAPLTLAPGRHVINFTANACTSDGPLVATDSVTVTIQ